MGIIDFLNGILVELAGAGLIFWLFVRREKNIQKRNSQLLIESLSSRLILLTVNGVTMYEELPEGAKEIGIEPPIKSHGETPYIYESVDTIIKHVRFSTIGLPGHWHELVRKLEQCGYYTTYGRCEKNEKLREQIQPRYMHEMIELIKDFIATYQISLPKT